MGFYKAIPDENIWVDKILKWIVDILVVVVLAFYFMHFFGDRTVVVGNSMSEALKNNDQVMINKLTYKLSKPERYDVIAFNQTNAQGDKVTYIKRIVALPRETVEIKDGTIYVNGKALDKFDNYGKIVNSGLAKTAIKLGYNEYFVLGDNVNSSEDSRFNTIGNVKYDDILGKVWFVSSPFVRIGTVK